MYEKFGSHEIGGTGQVRFSVFVPDSTLDPTQYLIGGSPGITDLYVVGSFQLSGGDPTWARLPSTRMAKSSYSRTAGSPPIGWLYSVTIGPLPAGFYEYKYSLSFESAPDRLVGDPCARYGGSENENAGIVVGGRDIPRVTALSNAARLPYQDLIVYELMVDDFTAEYRGERAPLDAVKDKLDYLVTLGVNAIEFMPWTAWPSSSERYSWGYDPYAYFSVSHPYTYDAANPADKIVYLKELIDACHRRGLQVLMDGVFSHSQTDPLNCGFPYYWLYQNSSDCPYTGRFTGSDPYFMPFDYNNGYAQEFVRDVAIYWIEVFKIDGIRFDETSGYFIPGDLSHGIPKLLADLTAYFAVNGISNFATALEHTWDYDAINVANSIGAKSCWLDPYRSTSMGYLGGRQIDSRIMRMLDSATSFAPGVTPTIYLENHDHQSFMDKAGSRDLWGMTQPYAIALFTCAGAVLVHNGQEFGTLCDMPEEGDGRVIPRPLAWEQCTDSDGAPLLALYQKLIAIRKGHAGLRSANFYPDSWDENSSVLNGNGFGADTSRQLVVYHRWLTGVDGTTERYYIALNFSQQTQHVDLQVAMNGVWTDLISGWTPTAASNLLPLDIGSNWGYIFYQKA